jgi:pimeloyl-ACP methyl ester carboxylesterase
VVPGIEHRTLIARDGTRIGYQLRPGDTPDAPAVVLANGLGGSYRAFEHLYPALAGCRVLCWDYRGLFSSAQPRDRRANTVGHQVDDLVQLLAVEGIDRAVHIGWSMGVQVNFEYYRRHPDRVVALMAINGTYGRPFRTVLSSRFVEKAIPHLLRLVRAQADLVGAATRLVAGSDAMLGAAVRLGLVSATADVALMRDLVGQFGTIDWRIYSDLLRRLDEHDAEDVLARVAVPTVIVTSDRDIITPPSTAEHMHRAIAGSRLVTIRGGTHYTPVEYAPILRDEIAQLRARLPGWVARTEARAAASR